MFENYIYFPRKISKERFLERLGSYSNYEIKYIDGIFSIKLGNFSKTIVYCYGNGTTAYDMLEYCIYFSEKNKVNIILFDYPGYGLSYDVDLITEKIVIKSLHKILKNLENVTLIGESIGTGVCLSYINTYKSDKISKLILISPFYNLISLVSNKSIVKYGFYMLSNSTYDNYLNINSVSCDVVIFCLKEDDVVPASHGHSLSSIKNCLCIEIDVPNLIHGDFGCFLLNSKRFSSYI